MKLRVYLDTSVFCAYYDDRTPQRMAETREVWARFPEFEVATSSVTEGELRRTPDPDMRARQLALLEGVVRHELTQEMRAVATEYIRAGVFTPACRRDALHVAMASLTRQDVLLSWNFRHLVNRQRRLAIATINFSLGLPTPEIVAPPEL